MAKITWLEPYNTVRGKFSKKSSLINKLAGTLHEQIAHRQGTRNTITHPVSNDELQARISFATIAPKVAARRKKSSPTYEQDSVAFLAQRDLPGGYQTFQKWLWADEKSK